MPLLFAVPCSQLLIEGNNLLRVMGIEGVNASRTTSNDVIEVEATLGIEAARSVVCHLVSELLCCFSSRAHRGATQTRAFVVML